MHNFNENYFAPYFIKSRQRNFNNPSNLNYEDMAEEVPNESDLNPGEAWSVNETV